MLIYGILYILTPLIFSLLWRWLKLRYHWITFFLTAIVVILFLPSLIMYIDSFLNPPIETKEVRGRCGMPLFAYYVANILFLLPITLAMQFMFNVWLLKLLKKEIPKLNKNKLIDLIDIALEEADNLVAESKAMYRADKEPIISTKKVLNLLKEQIQNNQNPINERILRAMHDVGASSYKDFENTPLEDAIGNVTAFLYNEISYYKKLEPLRMDFGKGNPI